MTYYYYFNILYLLLGTYEFENKCNESNFKINSYSSDTGFYHDLTSGLQILCLPSGTRFAKKYRVLQLKR